jgi:dGTPase
MYDNLKTIAPTRRWYQHDIDQIVYSESFRKLQRKGQLLSDRDPRCRSRMVHTLEVARIAKEISEQFGLNIELTEAIALGHDLGNTAFGHPTHEFLSNHTNNLFKHEEVSELMVLELSEKKIQNKSIIDDIFNKLAITDPNEIKYSILEQNDYPYKINISAYNRELYYHCISPEVLDGIVCHGTNNTASTLEGQVVNYADNIAYISQDINDLIYTKIMTSFDINDFVSYAKSSGLALDGLFKLWEEINEGSKIDLRKAFSDSTSSRSAVLIDRFIEYNKKIIDEDKLQMIDSKIFGTRIPTLKMDDGLTAVINCCWKITSKFYNNDIIKISNDDSKKKLEILWAIISSENNNFTKHNEDYNKFKIKMEQPLYIWYKLKNKMDEKTWKNWQNAYFIAHLTGDEIMLIINSFFERNTGECICLC